MKVSSSSTRKGLSHSEAGKLGSMASTKTHNKKRTERIKIYNNSPNKCKNCLCELKYEVRKNKFCSSSCSASFNNRGIRRHGKAPTPCVVCGKITKHTISKFCSNKCQASLYYKQQYERILKSGSAEGYGPSSLRRILLANKGIQCEICKRKTWQKQPIPVVIDHIDGHSDNNKLNNLRVICCNCNALLPTYAGRNRGNGRRQIRRKRYHEGKTY